MAEGRTKYTVRTYERKYGPGARDILFLMYVYIHTYVLLTRVPGIYYR